MADRNNLPSVTVSSNLPLVRQSRRVLPFLLNFPVWPTGAINVPLQQIYANSKGGLIIEGGVMSNDTTEL